MSADNVTMKRRATDWQQQPPTVRKPDVFGWYEGDDRTAVIGNRGLAHVSAALSGAQAIAAVLMQAALGRTEDDVDSRLKLCSNVEQGLISALASCLETVEMHTLDIGANWTTHTENDQEAQSVAKTVQSIASARYLKTAGRSA